MLKVIPLFSQLSNAELARIERHMTSHSYERGDVILKQGDAADSLFVIVSGQVKVFIADDSREVILSTLSSGELFGELPMFDQEPRSASASAVGICHLKKLPYESFRKVLDQSPSIARKVMQAMAVRLRHADRQIGTLSLMDISSRVSRTLMELAIMSNGRRIVGDSLTQKDIAGMVGASREMVNRTLRDLTEKGHIAVQRRSITILSDTLPACA